MVMMVVVVVVVMVVVVCLKIPQQTQRVSGVVCLDK